MRSHTAAALIYLACMLVLVGAAMSAAANRGPETSPVYVTAGGAR